jgi:hypothetical protein
LLDIQVSGQSKAVGATANHPFWSEDRQNWVSAGNLVSGERLRTVNGTALVQSITPRFTPQSVYNIEVSVDHTYLVTECGILVHNASGGCVVKPSLTAHKKALKEVHGEVGKLPKGQPGKFGSPQAGTPKKGYRLDPPHPGAKPGTAETKHHINWWDYTKGKKGKGGRTGAVPIQD